MDDLDSTGTPLQTEEEPNDRHQVGMLCLSRNLMILKNMTSILDD